jgi:menaquinone-specific isochorismate synthase
MHLHRDFAFIQIAPGRLFVGWGPFEHHPFRRPERPAFFITDFFLADPHPWRHPAEWEELTIEEFADRFSETPSPRLEWQPLTIEEFAPLFASAKSAIDRGEFKKIVPVIFETARNPERVVPWRALIRRLSEAPAHMTAYGYSYQHHAIIGATPEMLFATDGRGYQTIALAGTRPVDRAAELLRDRKELREHRLVVEDIVRRVAPFGNVEVEPLRIVEFPSIAHLATPIRFEESGADRMSFADIVRRLHPTAALGTWPRTVTGERWLRDADKGVKRRTFGAPFGLEREDRRGLALVAIRNVQWHADVVRVGSGAGLIAESRLEREFDELREKREQVKSLFGIGAPVHA